MTTVSRLVLGFLATLPLAAADARADRIILSGGGQVKGKLLAKPDASGKRVVIGERGKVPLTLRPEQIVQVIDEAGPLDGYVLKRNSVPETAQDHHNLALWCETNKLRDLAELHNEKAIALDPLFGPAHLKLGHVERAGKWLTTDEVKVADGMVKVKGRWVTLEEKSQLDAKIAFTGEQNSWSRRLKVIRAALLSEDLDRRIDAEAQLAQIEDPIAVRPLLKTFGSDPSPFRSLLARVLGKIPGPESAAGLVDLMLAEVDQEVRQAIATELIRRTEATILDRLRAALASQDTAVINRAAWTLGQIRAKSAVPKLITALTTTEYQVEMISSAGTGPNAPGAGAGTGFFSGSVRSLPILTGPYVGNGVVAFGAAAVPFQEYGSVSMGGGGPGGNGRGTTPVLVPYVHQNVEVLATLQTLTGQNFGYDATAWRRWVATQFHAQEPTRRVPQP